MNYFFVLPSNQKCDVTLNYPAERLVKMAELSASWPSVIST